MSIPEYDWLRNLDGQKLNELDRRYPEVLQFYASYGYEATKIEYSQKLQDMYEDIFSVHLTKSVELPTSTLDAVRKLNRVSRLANDLTNVIVPVEDYHVAFISDSVQAYREFVSKINIVASVIPTNLEAEVFHCDNVAVVIDDITQPITEDLLVSLERYGIPFIRRSVVGWTTDFIDNTAINLFNHFISRARPCQIIN